LVEEAVVVGHGHVLDARRDAVGGEVALQLVRVADGSVGSLPAPGRASRCAVSPACCFARPPERATGRNALSLTANRQRPSWGDRMSP
jgi:hypothetical protein